MGKFQKYEVLRMIERGEICHISLDHAEGILLIYRLQRGDTISKNQLFRWLRQLAQQLDLYYRSGASSTYRYLNPYSVLVTPEEEILLLDMEAKSNEFAIRNMQKRAMRSHFLRPMMQMRDDSKMAADLYSLGKTMQFILACTEVRPFLSLLEEYQLKQVIQKCLGEHPRKRYQNIREVLKELPKEKQSETSNAKGKRRFVAVFAACLAVISVFFIGRNVGADTASEFSNQSNLASIENEESSADDLAAESDFIDENVTDSKPAMEDAGEQSASESELDRLRRLFLENTKEGNEQVLQEGELLKSEILYYLASAYDRENQVALAILTYGGLCDSHCEDTVREQSYYRKAYLERANGQAEQAMETCKKGLEHFSESEKITALLKEMESEMSETTEITTEEMVENAE